MYLHLKLQLNHFLLNHIKVLSGDYDITVVVNTKHNDFLSKLGIDAKVIPLEIDRKINLISDLICLIMLIRLLGEQTRLGVYKNMGSPHLFLAVHSVTPKTGLLAMLAVWVNKVPLRVHTFIGQV